MSGGVWTTGSFAEDLYAFYSEIKKTKKTVGYSQDAAVLHSCVNPFLCKLVAAGCLILGLQPGMNPLPAYDRNKSFKEFKNKLKDISK